MINHDDEVKLLRESQTRLFSYFNDLYQAIDEPLRLRMVDKHGQPVTLRQRLASTLEGEHIRVHHVVSSGVLWIPGPFKDEFWKNRRAKPRPLKCACTCGNVHKKKGV